MMSRSAPRPGKGARGGGVTSKQIRHLADCRSRPRFSQVINHTRARKESGHCVCAPMDLEISIPASAFIWGHGLLLGGGSLAIHR